jgi:membrane-bound lytic murein transglycosylase A
LNVLPGWREDDHAAAYAAFVSTCGVSQDPVMGEICRRARTSPVLGAAEARAFFEANFELEAVPEVGALTAYFAPEYEARSRREGPFTAPVLARPADLVVLNADGGRPNVVRRTGGRPVPYPDRTAIEASPPSPALAWMRPEELFLLQVQGSGVLIFPGGRRMKAAFAATNGQTYVAIANPMRERGLLPAGDTSADSIRRWLAEHRGPQADAIMRLNPRYVFFTLGPDDGRAPMGAARVPLPAGRAVAVDRATHAMGDLLWIDGSKPMLAGARPSYRRLAMALDIGGAIKGQARADLYLGQGAAAGDEAGRVRHELRLYRLTPRLGLASR